MKALFAGLCTLALIPASAFAVRVKDCPKSIKIETRVSALTVDQIFQNGGTDLDKEVDAKDVQAIRDLLFDVRKLDVTVNLKEAASSYCVYLPASESTAYGDNETRLVRKDGRDVLRVAKYLGETPSRFIKGKTDKQNVWFYVNVEQYSPEGIKITAVKGAKLNAWFDHGSPRVQFGWVNDISVK